MIWNTAAYMRLSKEDNENMISNSISNQRVLIKEYIAKCQDLNLIDYYIDDGYSGTSFNRPAFKRLLEDIRDKKVNAIIVKDLSRFGRNHIEVDNYIENIFPVLNVRFISIIDEEASKIVKIIFEKTINGLSKKEIANILNEMKIETPMEHIKNRNENKRWNSDMIYRILKNKTYTGTLIQQKRKRLSYKNHKMVQTENEELIITESHHKAIIDREQFEKVQGIIKHSIKTNSNNEYDIFSGYLKCVECESNLTIKKSKEYIYYACSSHVRKRGCNNKHTIRKDILEEKVIAKINNRQAKKIDKLNRKYIYDLINMIYLNQDGSIKIEFKRK